MAAIRKNNTRDAASAASSRPTLRQFPRIRLAALQKNACATDGCGLPSRLNLHRSQTLPAVSFFEGFQTPAGLEKTRAHSCGRHLKPITKARHGHCFRAQPLNLWQRNFSGQINSTAMRSVAMIHQTNLRHSTTASLLLCVRKALLCDPWVSALRNLGNFALKATVL